MERWQTMGCYIFFSYASSKPPLEELDKEIGRNSCSRSLPPHFARLSRHQRHILKWSPLQPNTLQCLTNAENLLLMFRRQNRFLILIGPGAQLPTLTKPGQFCPKQPWGPTLHFFLVLFPIFQNLKWGPFSLVFFGPRCPWGPIYGSGCLWLEDLCRLSWCDSGWWR